MLLVGVMSGTSCDGVDVVLVDFEGPLQVVKTHSKPYPETLKSQLLQLINNQPTPAASICQLDVDLARFYADAINTLLQLAGKKAADIMAIGLHGQTLWHSPDSSLSNTWQLGSATATAAFTGITTVANFRQLDMCFGGQGAPLAPAFHQHLFQTQGDQVAVINLGGIANITWLVDGKVMGYDVGPASCLMDAWIMRHLSQAFDDQGQWAATGQVIQPLLTRLMQEPYLQLSGPKSTGRELFNLTWLDRHLMGADHPPEDIQRTLLQFTVSCIQLALTQAGKAVDQIIVCGGGTHNRQLMKALVAGLPAPCHSSEAFGVDPDFVEATLMAWMAERHMAGVALDLTAVTGANQPLIYGVRHEPR